MGKDRSSLGSDEITAATIIAVLVFLDIVALICFTNCTAQAKELGGFFFGLGIFVLVWLVFDLIFKRAGRNISSKVDLPDS